MCVCVCVRVSVCLGICSNSLYACECVCVYVSACVCPPACVCKCVRTGGGCARSRVCVCVCVCVCVQVCVHMCGVCELVFRNTLYLSIFKHVSRNVSVIVYGTQGDYLLSLLAVLVNEIQRRGGRTKPCTTHALLETYQ